MRKLLTVLAITLAAAPAFSNALIAPGPQTKIAKSSFAASPAHEWNRLSAREGKNTETWTIDGPGLNKVVFYGGVPVGQPMFREADKKNRPLPKVTPNMLITDIPVLLETSYRSQFNASQMSIDSQVPAEIGGRRGVRFTYSFAKPDDEVRRRGEAVGAIVGDKLFLVTYEAPAIHFFDKDLAKFRQLAGTLKI